MKLLVQTAMIFFGTLMAAGLVALGEPKAPQTFRPQAGDASVQALTLLDSARPWVALTSASTP